MLPLEEGYENEDWRSQAACLGVGPDLFYPEGSKARREQAEQMAKVICAKCRVRRACLDYALAKPEQFGVWGGLNWHEREAMKRMGVSSQNLVFS
jgi:WhiB family transcriptional regulator, redox-sensing transcriptional regulator